MLLQKRVVRTNFDIYVCITHVIVDMLNCSCILNSGSNKKNI